MYRVLACLFVYQLCPSRFLQCVETCSTSGEGWNSNVTVVERGQTFLTLEWEMDQPDTVYRVRWFQERVFIGEDDVSPFE